MKPKTIAFDIIETVFSLESMRGRLSSLELPSSALETWFAAGLRDAFALAVTGRFAPFRSVLEAVLIDLLRRHGLAPAQDQIDSVLGGMKSLEPQPDAAEAFAAVKEAGFVVLALSNGATASTQALLERGGLTKYVNHVFSVDDVRLSKPRREVYLHAADAIGVAPGELALVATHAWDTHGAKAAGLMTAFVSRGRPYPATMLPPDFQGAELADIAKSLVSAV